MAGTCALGLIAACAGPSSKDAGSSEAAATESKAAPVSGFQKVCSVNGLADLSFSPGGGDVALVTGCDNADAPGSLNMYLLSNGKHIALTDEKTEAHNPRWSADGQFAYWAAFDRTAGRSTVHVHVHDFKNKRDKDIPLFDANIADADGLLEKRIASFDVKFAPDGLTAVAYGYETKEDGSYEGRVMVSPMDHDGEKLLDTVTSGISADADVTFSPDNQSLLVLSTMGAKPAAEGDKVRQHIYEITLGRAPAVTEAPEWIIQKNHGEVVVVPGSYDGASVLRWGADSALPDGGGYVSIAKHDGTQIALSKDAAVTSHSPIYKTDAEMHKRGNVAAFYASGDPAADVIFPGVGAAGKHSNEAPAKGIFTARRDGSAPATALAMDAHSDGPGFVGVAGKSVLLYPSTTGIGMIDLAAGKASVVTTDTEDHVSYIQDVSFNGKFALIDTAVLAAPAPAKQNAGTDNAGTQNAAAPPQQQSAAMQNAAKTQNGNGTNAPSQATIDTVGLIQLVDLATMKTTDLKLDTADKLRVSGALDGDWASTSCGYDDAKGLTVLDDGSVLGFATFHAANETCKRAAASAEVIGWKPTGEGASIPLEGVTTLADFGFLRTDRAIATQCGADGLCSVFIELPPGQLAIAEAKPESKKPATGGEGGDETGLDPDDGDDGDDGVVVRKHGPTSSPSTGSEQSTTTGDTTKVVSTGGCSSAPGTGSSSLGGLGLLLGLTVLTRRRRATK